MPRKNAEPLEFKIPILASAMDGVVDVRFAIAMSKLGGLAVLNLEGVQTRYKNPQEVLQKIVEADKAEVTAIAAKNLPGTGAGGFDRGAHSPDQGRRRDRGGQFDSATGRANSARSRRKPARTFLSCKARSRRCGIFRPNISRSISKKFCRDMRIPVIVGNTVGYDVTFEIMECGPAAVLIGVGPGAACTSRGVLGLGVPQVTATVDCAAARDAYFKKTARYVPIITDGGMSKGGDVCKALACGADAVMVGSAFAKAQEAPGQRLSLGHGHAARQPPARHPHQGRRDRFAASRFSSARRKWTMAARIWSARSPPAWATSARATIAEFQQTEIIIAPSIKTEGKLFQTVQSVGMGTR